MDKTNAVLYEAKIHADENRSKDVRHFSASVVEAIEELQGQLHDAEESNKAVERALADVDYRGSYADGVLFLKQQLAAALAACEAKDKFLQFAWRDVPMSDYAFSYLEEALTIKPDAFILKAHDEQVKADFLERSGKWLTNDAMIKAHDEALIERCASLFDESPNAEMFRQDIADVIRELKRTKLVTD